MSTSHRMSYPGWPIVLLLIALATAFLVQFVTRNGSGRAPTPTAKPTASSDTHQQPTIGQTILKNYGTTAQPPQQDLTDLFRALDNFSLLVKGDNPVPLGANEEIAAALRGKNKARLVFLPADAPCFNPQGQVIDRWGTPLFFHATDRQRIDIRSAGPDKEMWTQDDLHRRYDGQFLKDQALLTPSLYETTRDFQPQGQRK
ncbi:MAG: hypothetical protein JNJ83_10490 [Verrucomicrobiaceae bacterium]|nr:hypothetical protein [Verrucomicrobiaceae bacterium]